MKSSLPLLAAFLLLPAPLSASDVPKAGNSAEPTKEQAEFFEKHVRPILVERCYSCHSTAEKKQKGGLVVDSLDGLRTGGDTGPALDAAKPDESLFLKAVRYTDDDLKMPPKGKLPDAEIDVLVKWVKMGTPWPNAKAGTRRRKPGTITDDDRKWWAFQPVKVVDPPAAGEGWARTPVDRFISEKHKSAGLTPAGEATRAVLARRLYFDLHGLPPTPEEVDAFVNDADPQAYEKLVDRLLASPRYGERMARLWLDLVRYADSDGYRIDDYRPQAWRYRDYVVRAFNADKPYDRFVQEQLAGDEMFPGDPDATVAVGYLRHWIYEYNQRDVRTQWDIILTDLTDTTGDVFLGLGMQCARCHDHKFDPILQKDYFRLRAFFANVLPREDVVAATEVEKTEYANKLKVWQEKTAAIRAAIDAIEAPYKKKAAEASITKFPPDIEAMIRKPVAERNSLEHQLAELAYRQVYYEFDRIERTLKPEDKEKVLALRRKLAEFDSLKPAPLPMPPTVTDVGPIAPSTTIPKRGNTPIDPGFVTILDEKPATVEALPNSSGRRSTLAKWITRPDNPLTARVMVNRLWQHHFGRGLAANTSDFGRLGEPPTHPELLDWLAADFVQHGWSLKHTHRLIVTSAVYRQSSSHANPAPGKLTDPENKLLWRGVVRRLDAEQIRDSLLAVTGELDLKAGGPGTMPNDPRRSIFTRILRNNRDPLLDVFDAPYWFQSASSRDTTTTPVQSLLLFNGPFLLQRAKALAVRTEREGAADDKARLERAYRLTFGRSPTPSEMAAALAFLDEQAKRIDLGKAGSAEAGFVSGKIPHRDGQAAEVKPDGTGMMRVANDKKLPAERFTIEAYVLPRSVADTGAVRTIVAKWDGTPKNAGWAFGVTGKQSRRKPQTVVLQMFGNKQDGSFGEEALFSDQHIALNKPYYLAASVKLATEKEKGLVTFYLKDLSNDDEPLLVAKIPHGITGGLKNDAPLTIGGRGGKGPSGFDGLIDDVRFSDSPLGVDQLLFTHEGVNKNTVGYWQFEAKPNVFRDTSGNGLDIRPVTAKESGPRLDARRGAWVDLCHVLLNASEFLYVE
jgi:hypothetical protein